jgi:hypothetical protein
LNREEAASAASEAVVQRQFEAANAHDIDRFIAEFADDARSSHRRRQPPH